MRLLSITLVMLASMTSFWAQGQVVTSGDVCFQAPPNLGFVFQQLPDSAAFISFDSLPQSESPAFTLSDAILIEASRQSTLIDTSVMPILPPTLFEDSTLTSQSALSVQAVPEPDSSGLFALGGLLIALYYWRKSSPTISPKTSLGEH